MASGADFDLSMAITADGDQAASEIELVDSRVKDLNKSNKDSESQNRRTAASAAELAKQQKATADAINQVVRATNPAVGSQRALNAALAAAERAYIQGKISAAAYARAQEIANRATFNSVQANRSASAGMRGVGLQMNDILTQVSLGQSPMTAFAANIGQVGFAMSQMTGKAQVAGNFLAGPWGALIGIAAVVLGGFIGKLFSAGDAHKKHGEAADISKMSLEELTKAIDDNNEALEKSIRTTAEAEQKTLDDAEAHRKRAIRIREETVAMLEQAQAQQRAERIAPGPTPGGIGVGSARVGDLEAELVKANAALAKAQQEVALAQVPIARRRAQEATDPAAKIKGDYDRAVAAATKEFTEHGRDLAKLNRALQQAEREQQAANDALQESRKKHREVDLGDQISAELGQSILAKAQSFGGLNERRDKTALEELFKQAQINIDPEMVKWCAAFVNAVLATKGVRGTGTLAAKDFLGFGSATDKPQKGDIVVLPGHVGFFAGTQGKNVLVTGGNQGNQVSTEAFARSKVLGFRRPPTAADQFKDEQQAAEQAQREAEQLARFGEQAAHTIDQLGGKAVGTLQRAEEQTKQLDAIMAEVEKRKPPNLEELRANAAQARIDIQQGITKPFDDFLKAQRESLEVEQLRTAGLDVEADTLQEVYRLQEAMGKELLPEQVEQIYRAVAARKAESVEAKKAAEQQREYNREVEAYRDVFRSLFSGNPKDVTSFPKRLLQTAIQAKGNSIFNAIFGDQQDKATGVDKVRASNIRLQQSADKTAKAILKLGQAADQASGQVAGEGGTTPDDIAQGIDQSPLGSVLTKLGKGIGLSDSTINSISGIVTKGMNGAATGAVVQGFLQPLGKALGFKTSTTGAEIGGAIGSFIPIPGGDIIGSVIGSVVGGLFKKTKKGSATITNAFDAASITGNSGSFKDAAGSLAQSVQGALQQIAQTLGGTLGSFAVSIGVRHGDFRVDPSGRGVTKKSHGAIDFNDDQAAAIAFAIQDAIKDGAVKGLSEAVQKALKSSPDIDKALQEAVKVQNLEFALEGVFGPLDQAFRAFEQQAAERVRLAKTYGLDLVKVEELNGKERAKVLDDILKSRIGDLQNFLDSLKFGNLFEGTAAEQRTALLAEVARVRVQADAGEEGAASQLADLERQLLELSRNAFGTAGPEYAADRAAAQADAERIIAEETARAKEAQERAIATLNAATTQNDIGTETNNLLGRILGVLSGGADGSQAGGGGGGGLARFTQLHSA